MDIKKILTTGASVALVSMMAACSDDSSSPAAPPSDNPDVVDPSNPSSPTSSSSKTTAKSSSSVDANTTYVTISEIMYNAPETINGVPAADLEWVEVTITSGKKIFNMAHETVQLRLDGAITYNFPAEPLDVGEYVIVTNNVELFKQAYPTFTGRVFGPWDNAVGTSSPAKLSNEGDVIDVRIKGEGDNSCSYSKEPPWPSLANGKGHTLVFKGGNAAQSSNWGASKVVGGNPGAKDEWLEPSTVRINEMKPFAAGAPAWVELYNYGSSAVDVTGWVFESKVRNEKLKIAAGVVPAGGYLVLDGETAFTDEAGVAKELIVSDIGGEYYLYGLLDGDESSLMLPSSKLTSGIVDLKDGSIAQGALVTATPGAANSALYIGSVVINEINYHPAETDAKQIEFLEIKNVGATDVKLYETVSGTGKGWKIEGINKEFAPTDVLPAGGIMVLFPAETKTTLGEAGLRANYGIDANVQIGFYDGKLSNRGENIAIKKPFSKATDSNGNVQWYYEWSDASLYSDSWEGFKRTDGNGASMQRVDYTTMGHEPTAWVVGDPNPGK
ncbi:MAG: lamin tail domain-containing protein [Fibrobacter sp.]|nr:lamin tail domain-containing protein [Fibrobacter sp.]